MPSIFSPCVGAVTKINSCVNDQSASDVFAVRFAGPNGLVSFSAPITGFALEQNGNYQFLHTVNDFIYVYSFGDRIGELVISGIGFVKTCASAKSAELSNVFNFYKFNKLSENGKLSVTLGDLPDATFYAFLTGSRLELQDPQTMVGQWSLRFNVVSKKKK
jgi:hypothetical protein